MDPKRVLLFREVARAGSLSAAARELGSTQPAVSQQLRQLEREVRTRLLIRTARGVSLTEAGQLLLGHADALAAELKLARSGLDALADLESGTVRLAAFPSAASTLVPPALEMIRRGRPRLSITLMEAEPEEAIEATMTGSADLAVIFGYDGPPQDVAELVWQPLFIEPMYLVCARGASMERNGALDFAAIASSPWIAGCPRCREHLVERCRAAGFAPKIAHESDDYVVCQNLAAHGMGVTVMPRMALQAFRHPQVDVRVEAAFGERHVGVVFRRGAEAVPAIRYTLNGLAAKALSGHEPDG